MVRVVFMMLMGCVLITGCAWPSGHSGRTNGEAILKPIDTVSSVYLARREDRITVTSEGLLRYVLIMGKSYGPHDGPAGSERHELHQGPLAREQMAELVERFGKWDALSQTPYGGVADGPEIAIQYGDHKVTGGSLTPPEVWEIFARLRELGSTMPVARE